MKEILAINLMRHIPEGSNYIDEYFAHILHNLDLLLDEPIPPNHWYCDGCLEWDDVNGCWAGFENWYDCDRPDPWDEFDDLPDEQGRW